MYKLLTYSLTRLLCLVFTIVLMSAYSKCNAQVKFHSPEQLGRGLVALPARGSSGNFISWRLLGTDDKSTTFDLLRDGTVIAADLDDVTNYTDLDGSNSSKYQIRTKVRGQVTETSGTVSAWSNIFRTLKLDRPSDIYTPNDCSVGDVDGDGEYELFVKWDPNTAQDNSKGGKTDKVYIDCYRLNGTRLWRIDLGDNIRAGAHYTQFLVYDFDNDGKAELICKTAPGSKDANNRYVSLAATQSEIKNSTDNTTVYANSSGYILSGPEYLTVFNGQTGAAIHTVYYRPNRAGGTGGAPSGSDKNFWGDNYGNRCDRYLACVAYLDGQSSRPSAVMCRGYYTKAYLWAVDFNGSELSTKWLHASTSSSNVTLTDASGNTRSYTHNSPTSGSGSATAYSNGNHNLSVADVDGDGKDEIVYGSAAIDHDGRLLYATGFGHGDAIHLSDLIPDRPGLEVFQVHESKGTYSWDLHDAGTGEIIHKGGNSGVDNGRGLSADLLASNRGFEFLSSDDRNPRSATTGDYVFNSGTSVNFRVYWDGDLQDELLDDKKLDKVTENGVSRFLTLYQYGASVDCNSTKHTPCLQADIFGDWREEIIYFDANDGCTLNIFSTNVPTQYRVPTLMHDHVYRLGIAWQNVAYNQPPHLGFYLPDYVLASEDYDNDISAGKEKYDLTAYYSDELSTASLSGWSNSGMTVNSNLGNAPYSNNSGTALVDFPFFERWVSSNSTLANTSITRTISNLPNGSYYVGGSFIATQQGNASADITGVTFSANGSEVAISTGNGVPGVFSVKATVTDGTLTFGLNTSSTNANWIAMDNLFLYFAGDIYDYMNGASENAPAIVRIENAGMDASGGWSVSPAVNYSCGEFYQKSFDLYQTLANAPDGKYVFKAQGFQRPGTASDVYSNYSSGNNNVAAYLYVGETSALLKNICAEAQTTSRGGSESTVGNGLYVPNNMEAAGIYFSSGLYNNSVETVFDGGDLRYGISATNNGSYNWTIFDNFELLYYGEIPVDKDPSASAIAYDITNAMPPYLSTSSLDEWSNSGMQLQKNYGDYSNPSVGASVIHPFFEKWTKSGTLDDASISQTITGLPAGQYYIGGSFIATLQSNDAVRTKGAIFFAGNESIELRTKNGVPEIYSLLVEVTDGTLTYGVRTQSTTANWVAMDNFFIKRVGTENDYLAQATIDNPVRIVISNPRMENSTSGWNLTGNTSGSTDIWQLQNASYANFNPTFMESWIPSGSNLSNKSATQTLSLPQGLYKFSAAVNATKQDSNDKATGCSIFIDDNSTACATNNGQPEVFYAEAILDAGEHTFGVNIESANFNWFAWDNAILYYYGEYDPSETVVLENNSVKMFCPSHSIDLTDVSDDVRAFIATGYNNGTLLLKSVKKIPAGTGVMLRGVPGTYDIPYLESGNTDDMSNNMLKGVLADTEISTIANNCVNYNLKNENGISYFTVVTGVQTIPAGSAYLSLPDVMSLGAKRINIGIGDNATGINSVEISGNGNGDYYTITGVKVGKPTKGVYIHNGKKVYVK